MKIFVGFGDVYLIEGVELDVESDFFPDEYEMIDIEKLISHQGIDPIRSENGYIDIPKNDVVVYLADKGEVDYAVAFKKYKVKQNGYEMEM